MSRLLGKWLKVYEAEIVLFCWTVFVYFLIRTSNVIFDNFADAAFLKRYGVQYLPMVYIANGISTFFAMGFVSGIMGKIHGSRLLGYMLIFCGCSVAAFRFAITYGVTIIYPVLWVLKAQYEVLLGLVFWDLANDLFNTRQSKRLFPLITAGGVLGAIIGSMLTPVMKKYIGMDNILFAYLGVSILGAMAVRTMGIKFPTMLLSEEGPKKKGKKKAGSSGSMIAEFKNIIPLIKESLLIRILVILNFVPNIMIAIVNYQFNFVADQTFATEGGIIGFFSYFKASMNTISLIVLFFVGRIYERWGLPVALMIHPSNYVIAFMAYLFKFNIISGLYSQVTTTVLRNTINNPARSVMVGLVPPETRSIVRPFLRGTVVRIGTLAGSGIILLMGGFFHPRYLSVVAILFMSWWWWNTWTLKKRYSEILLDLISKNMLDLKSMEGQEVRQVFRDKKIQAQLVEAFHASTGKDCLWYGGLMKSMAMEDLDRHILSVIQGQDTATQIGLLDMLSPDAGAEAIPVFRNVMDPGHPDLQLALIRAARRIPHEYSGTFLMEIFKASADPEVKGYAAAGLYSEANLKHRESIYSWMRSSDLRRRMAGVIAAGDSRDNSFSPALAEMLRNEENVPLIPHLLRGLGQLGASGVAGQILPYLGHKNETVRMASLTAVQIDRDEVLRKVIGLLDDPVRAIAEMAKTKIKEASYQNPQVLVEALTFPRRKVREEIFSLLEDLNVGDRAPGTLDRGPSEADSDELHVDRSQSVKVLDVFRFTQSQLERAYHAFAEAEALRRLPEGEERDLLITHLTQEKSLLLENMLRLLATQDLTGHMRIIWRGLSSADPRQRSNSLEALEESLTSSLSRIMIPLLEERPAEECLAVGRRHYHIQAFDSDMAAMFHHLLGKPDWVTVVLTLHLLYQQGNDGLDGDRIKGFLDSENHHIRKAARRVLDRMKGVQTAREDTMNKEIGIGDRVFHLRKIQIFEGLSVSELATVASIAEEATYPPGEIVIREGEPGETMYLVVSGEVIVIKGYGSPREIELDRIMGGDYFGEMALFDDAPRSATIRAKGESRMLVLHKREFSEIVREYPQIALHICKVLSQRMRHLQQKIQNLEECPDKSAP